MELVMDFVCEHCGKQYRIDPSRLTKETVRIRCKRCGKAMSVSRIPEPSPREETPADPGNKNRKAAAPGERKSARRGPGILARLLPVMLLVAALPVVVFSLLLHRQVEATLMGDLAGGMERAADSLAVELTAHLEADIRTLRVMAGLPAILSMEGFKQYHVLKTLKRESTWIRQVYTVDGRGKGIISGEGGTAKESLGSHHQAVIAQGREVITGVAAEGGGHLLVAVPIRGGGRILGAIVAVIEQKALARIAARWEQRYGCAVLMTDGEGTLLVRSDSAGEGTAAFDTLLATRGEGAEGKAIPFSGADGRSYLGCVRESDFGWRMALWQPAETSLNRLQPGVQPLLVATGGLVLLGFAAAWLFARSLTVPLRRMQEAVGKMARGNLAVAMRVTSGDEIGRLAAALDNMQRHLHQDRERRSAEVTEALRQKRPGSAPPRKDRFSAQRKK
jgi:predicted Zn finger-like uncharacterized protein